MKTILIFSLFGLITYSSFAQSNEGQSNNSSKTAEKMETKNNNDLQSFNDYQEVLKALEPYIKSAATGDGKLSTTAFYEHAHIVGSIDGEYSDLTVNQFGDAVSATGASDNIRHHIAWIDISGPAAAAKVEFHDWAGLRFTDFFVLYKKDGSWKISGKVYDSHSRN